MRTLEPIGIATQLDNVLQGQPTAEKLAIQMKIEHVTANVDKVVKINEAKVWNVSIDGKYIEYTLTKNGPLFYYPIQYAKIELL